MMKLIGKRSAGKPHAAFDAAGAGNMVCKDACASTRPYPEIDSNKKGFACKLRANPF